MESSANVKAHYKYRSQLLSLPTSNVIKVLMIGNNPREMGCLSDHLRGYTWKKFKVNATFDLKHGMQLAQSQKPDYILLDHALDKDQLTSRVRNLRRQKIFKNTHLHVVYRARKILSGQSFEQVTNFIPNCFHWTGLKKSE